MNQFKVLIIDDEPNYPTIAKYYLEGKGNFKVFLSQSGISGVETAKKEKPDVVFLDIMMPDMDGIETLKTFKNTEDLKNIPVFMLTAVETDKAMREAKDLKAAGYLNKPVEMEEMLARIDEIKKNREVASA